MIKLRLGQVKYSNCLPVYFAMMRKDLRQQLLAELAAETGEEVEIELVADTPARLNAMLLAGEIDVTAMSSIEYARHWQECYILPDLTISADGPVYSILFISRRPLSELAGRTVAVTSSSATSVALLQIICRFQFGVEPRLQSLPPQWEQMLTATEGALLIGDEALTCLGQLWFNGAGDDPGVRLRELQLYFQTRGGTLSAGSKPALEDAEDLLLWDLGALWKKMTGLPMVYALWVVKKEKATDRRLVDAICRLLLRSRRVGYGCLGEMASYASKYLPLPPSFITFYLKNINYHLNNNNLQGLREYYRYAYRCGLLPCEVREIRIWPFTDMQEGEA